MSGGMVASWGTRVFVLAEDEEEAQKLFKKQKVAVETIEEVDSALKAKEGTRSIRKSGTQVADVAGVAGVADVENTKSKSKSKNKREDSTSSDRIVVLTYNVLYKIGDPVTHAIKQCEKDVCVKNVCRFIDREANDCDFIGIQEYIKIDKLIGYSKKLRSMGHSHTEYKHKHNEYLLGYGPITFYDKAKYKLDEECGHMKLGFMKGLGRGIQINFFNKWLCVINVHAGHKKDRKGIDTFEKSLDWYFKSKYCSTKCKETYIRKLKEYEIIMLGDMNDKIPNDFSFQVDGKTRSLVGRTRESTCCGDEKKMNGDNTNSGAYDHILSTFSNQQKTKTKVYTRLERHSDHNPVKSSIVA
jgi:exonuclease III